MSVKDVVLNMLSLIGGNQRAVSVEEETGFAVGVFPEIPAAPDVPRGSQVRTEGGPGVADAWAIVLKTDSDTKRAYYPSLSIVSNFEGGGAETLVHDHEDGSAGGTLSLAALPDITASAAELNTLDGITSSVTELNVLDGIPATLTATELGYVDGTTSNIQTQFTNKQPLDTELTQIAGITTPAGDRVLFYDLSANSYAHLTMGTGLAITGTTLNADLTGTAPIFTDFSNANHDHLDADDAGTLTIGAIPAITVTAAKINYLTDVTSNIQAQIDGKQAADGDLTTISGLSATTNNFMVANASAWASRTPAQAIAHLGLDADIATLSLPASTTITTFGASLIDDAAASNALTTLGLDADIATFVLPASTTISTFGASLVDDADAATARTTLGISGTSGLVYVAGNTFSGSSAVNVNSCFTSTYENYVVMILCTSTSTNASVTLRLRVGGVDASGTNYYSAYAGFGMTTVASATSWVFTPITGAAASEITSHLTITRPQSSNETGIHFSSSCYEGTAGIQSHLGAGVYIATTSYDGFSIIPSSGTITGLYKVYGMANS